MRSAGAVRIRRIYPVEDSVAERTTFERDIETPPEADGASVVRGMPRRRITRSIDNLNVVLPRARRVVFKAGVLQTIGRLSFWLWGFLRFYAGNLLDVLRGLSSVQARAERLRR